MDFLTALYAHREELAAGFGALVISATALVTASHAFLAAVRRAAVWLVSFAATTSSRVDDQAAARLLKVVTWALSCLDGAAGVLGSLTRLLRPVSLAPAVATRDGRTSSPSGSAALGALLLIAATALGGCSMTAIEATQASVATAARLTTAVDPIVAAAYDDVTEGLDEGTLSTEDAAVRLRRLDRAERALGSMRHALIAVDYSIEAYAAGETCGLRAALDGAVAAAQELLRALQSAGLDVPDIVHIAAALASGYVEPVECRPDRATTATLERMRVAL